MGQVRSFANYFISFLVAGLIAACSGGSATNPLSVWEGTKQVGFKNIETIGYSIAIDKGNNIYVAGWTKTDINDEFSKRAFLTKYDSSGKVVYTKEIGEPGEYTAAFGVAVDANGNVYVYGDRRRINLEGDGPFIEIGVFLAKFDRKGEQQFTRTLGGGVNGTYSWDLAIDNSGNIFIAGYTFDNLDGNIRNGITDLFITKFDTGGNQLFTKQMGVSGNYTAALDIAIDASNNVYITGETSGGLDGNAKIGNSDAFIIKFDNDGYKQFSRQWGSAGANTYAYSIAIDPSGDVYVGGSINAGLDGNDLTGEADAYIIKFDSDGNKIFTRQIGAPATVTYFTSVSVDKNGHVYIGGTTNGGLGGNGLIGTYDAFVAKYDSSGVRQFLRQIGDAGAETFGSALTIDTGSNVFLLGTTTGGVDGKTLTGTTDYFITKFDANGVKQ